MKPITAEELIKEWYTEWLLLFGHREVSCEEMVSKGLHTIGHFLHSEGYLKYCSFAHYKLKQPHEIKENNEPTT